MASTTTDIAGLLKRVYDNYVEQAQNLKHRTLDEVAMSLKKYTPDGEGFFGSINDYGNESGGAQNEDESFRTIDSEHYTQWKVSPKVIAWPVEFTGLAAAAASRDQAAFTELVVDIIDRAKERTLSDENRQLFGSGNGLLATPSASYTAAVVSIAVASTQYLRQNQVVDIFTGATKTVDSRRIVRVDHQNKVIYFATSLGVAIDTTMEIVKENIRDSAPADGKEAMGLRGIVDDGTDVATFQNISVAANDSWKSTRINASSGNLTSDLLQRLIDDVEILSGESPDLLLTHAKQRRKYLDIVVPQKRFMDGKLDAGHTEVTFNGRRMLLDKDCQSDTLYAVNKAHLRRFEIRPLEMGGFEGSDKFLRTSGKDVFQAYWRHYMNFGTDNRIMHGKLVNLAVPGGLS